VWKIKAEAQGHTVHVIRSMREFWRSLEHENAAYRFSRNSETIIMLAIISTIAAGLTNRMKRLENNVEDLRMRVIYGVKP
jgi:hypothetical protein